MLHRAEREIRVATSPKSFLDVVWAFDRYPEFVTGIAAVRVLSREALDCHVEITAKLMGIPFRYELACVREENRVHWKRVAGAFRDAQGAWTLLEEQPDSCVFRYENAVDPGIPVPGFILRYVLETSLPRLLSEFRARIESMNGRSSSGTAK
jgi:ribosome-associated toxin RatA of RatAB toxin-antitoxin module